MLFHQVVGNRELEEEEEAGQEDFTSLHTTCSSCQGCRRPRALSWWALSSYFRFHLECVAMSLILHFLQLRHLVLVLLIKRIFLIALLSPLFNIKDMGTKFVHWLQRLDLFFIYHSTFGQSNFNENVFSSESLWWTPTPAVPTVSLPVPGQLWL